MNLATLICQRDLRMGTICLESLRRCAAFPAQFVIHEDGSLTEAACDQLRQALPGCTIRRRREQDEMMAERLRHHPACRAYREEHPFGLKLLDIPLTTGNPFLYCDTDILFFKRFTLESITRAGGERFVFMQDPAQGYSARLKDLRFKHRLRLPANLNAGFMWIPPRRFDLDLVEWFLKVPEFRMFPALMEQTIWAVMTRDVDVDFADWQQLYCATDGFQFRPTTVGIHFYYYHRPGVDRFAAQASGVCDTDAPVDLKTRPAPSLNMARMLLHSVRQRLRRLTGKP